MMATHGRKRSSPESSGGHSSPSHSSGHQSGYGAAQEADPWAWVEEAELSTHDTFHSFGRTDLEAQLFYARSRGIREAVAKRMILPADGDSRQAPPEPESPAPLQEPLMGSGASGTDDDDYDPWDWIDEEELDAHARMHMLGFTEFEEKMFYSRSRGINQYVAKRLIVNGDDEEFALAWRDKVRSP